METLHGKKKAKLFEDFPILRSLEHEWRWRTIKNAPWAKPKLNVRVQLADPEAMHLQARNINYLDQCYAIRAENDDRGTRFEYLVAVNHNDMQIATLFWEHSEHEKMFKDIFKMVPPNKVSYLAWVSVIEWHKPASEQREIETNGILFGLQKTGVELNIIVFRKPQDASFEELIETADRQKKEREEAYKFPPKEMPEFPGIHQALADGCLLHAFSSGGGLRVVHLKLEGKTKGYGEHPHIEEALKYLEEDFLAGGRPYNEVYGKSKAHYLTGATLSTSNLDWWIRKGSTFDCWQENDEIVVVLEGCAQTETPKEVEEQIERTGAAVQWRHRDYLYQTERSNFPNGDPCLSTKIIKTPPGKAGRGSDPWMYPITKTGRGQNFWEAMKQAFDAPEVEVRKD
jgi:hypothetical protein